METYRLHRGRLIDHIQLVVNDFEASKAFYTAVLAVLEIPVVNTYDDYFWADELVVSSINSPGSAGKPTGRHHLAFQARDRETVDAFYQAALAHGAESWSNAEVTHTSPSTGQRRSFRSAVSQALAAGVLRSPPHSNSVPQSSCQS
ncbi:VOC family protein [Klebsiella michiganensis]|uniref:VOC family protein n=1 Tax=Klebsiella michiganensis TaxID=1134687 RepID=UPI002A363AAA|nr:VOC family protein [Klebsiella michiganensis]